jgi:AcrR family transcriptional regulator
MPPAATEKRLPGRPRDEALQQRRREEILDRAAVTFAEHGYPNTDVQWVADALGLSKGTIYRYFPSKSELFLAAVRRGVERLHEHISQSVEPVADPLQRIVTGISAYLQFFKEHPQIVELFIQERAEFKSSRPIYFEHRDARRGPWRQIIADLIAAGRLRDVPPERVIDVMGDVLYGTMFTNHFAGNAKPHQAQAADVLDLFFQGILTDSERAARANSLKDPS